jgi:hypothetical protein
MDTETKTLLRDLRVSLDQFTRQAGSISKLAARSGANPPSGGGSGGGGTGGSNRGPGSAGDEFEDWWEKRKRDWNASSDSMSKFGTTTQAVDRSFKLLAKNSDQAAQSFLDLSKKLFGGTVGGLLIGGFTNYTIGLGKTYQEMSEAGTRFSDSLFGMAKAALETGTTLEEAARINKRNSVVAAALNGSGNGPKGGLVGLAATVRRSAEEFGSFGYTVAQLDDLVGDYAETLRQQGHAEQMSRADASDSFMKVAATADVLASQFGKSRKEIMDTANAAMRDEVYRAKLASMSSDQAKQYGDAFGAAIMGLSAQAGDAGKMLSKMLAQTASFDGRSYNTDAARELFNKVLPQGTEQMRQMAENIKRDPNNALQYQADYVKTLKRTIQANRQNLMYLAEGTGAEAAHARQLLQMDADLKESSAEQVKHQMEMNALAKKSQESLTKITLNSEQVWMRFSTNILGKFLPLIQGPMEAIAKGLDRFSNSPAWGDVTKRIEAVGKGLSDWVNSIMSESNMNDLANWVGQKVEQFGKWVGQIDVAKITGFFNGLVAVGEAVVGTVKGVVGAFETIASIAGTFGIGLKEAVVGLGAFYLAVKAFGAISSVLGGANALMGRDMKVNAKVVNVHGPAGGGGWGNQKDKRPGSGGSRLGRAGRFAAGAAILGGSIWALEKGLGVFGGLFQKDQEQRAEAAKRTEASTAELPEVLDDFNRQLLDNKLKDGTASEADKAALKRDDDAHAARVARAQSDAANDPNWQGPQQAGAANPATVANIVAAAAPSMSQTIMGALGAAGAVTGLGAMGGALRGGGATAAGAAAASAEGAAAAATTGGRLARYAGVIAKGVGAVAKFVPILGSVVAVGSAGLDWYNLKKKRDAGEITEEEYQEGMTKAVTAGVIGAIPYAGAADLVTGGAISGAVGGAVYRNGVAPLTGTSQTPGQPGAPGSPASPRNPTITNLEERIATMQTGESISRAAANTQEAVLAQLEEMNNRLASLIITQRDGTERIVRAANQTSNNVSNLAT